MDDANLKTIKLLVLDVDGVLTDGGIFLAADGGEMKRFCVQDGTAIKWLQRAGFSVALMTGRRSAVVQHRAEELGIEQIEQGVHDKGAAMTQLIARTGLRSEQIAYIGDDLIDLPAMRQVGCAVAVANARTEVKAEADIVTEAAGGDGAVREFAERLMKATGDWEKTIERYFR